MKPWLFTEQPQFLLTLQTNCPEMQTVAASDAQLANSTFVKTERHTQFGSDTQHYMWLQILHVDAAAWKLDFSRDNHLQGLSGVVELVHG